MLWLAKGMDKEVYGQIVAREAKYTTTQALTGNKSYIQSLKCTYEYKINGIKVQDFYYLDYSTINSEKLNKIKINPLPIAVKIKYSTHYPYRSMIWLP